MAFFEISCIEQHGSLLESKGGFPLSRNFYVRTDVNFNWLYVRKWNRDDVWKAARKRKSWARLNFYVYARPSIHRLYFIYARKAS